MSPRLFLICLTANWVFLSEAASQGPAANVKPNRPRLDLLDDPLPPGVVARLGTTRLFQPDAFAFAFSPDGKALAAVNSDGGGRLWEVSSGRLLQEFTAGPSRGSFSIGAPVLDFSPDGKLLAIGGGDGAVHVWDVGGGLEHCKLGGPQSEIEQVGFRPTGRAVVAGWLDGTVRAWDLESMKPLGDWTTHEVLSGAAFAADGTVVAVGWAQGNERQLIFHNWKAGQEKETPPNKLTLDFGDKETRSWVGAEVLSSGGGLFAYRTPDEKRLWLVDPTTGKESRRIEGPDEWPSMFRLSGNDKALAAAFPDGTVRVWETAGGKLTHEFKPLSTSIDRIALSRDGALIALMGMADGAIHIWDVAKARELHEFAGHRGGRVTVAFSHDGKAVFTTTRENANWPVREWADWSLRRWDATTGKELSVTQMSLGQVRYTSFSPDGRLLAVAVHDGSVHVLDADSGKELYQMRAPTKVFTLNAGPRQEKLRYLAQLSPPVFSPDGKTLFAAGAGELDRLDAITGQASPPVRLPYASEFIGCVARGDGQQVVVTEWDGKKCRAVLLDPETGTEGRELAVTNAPFPADAFSPDGRTFAIRDGSGVCLKEVASGRSRGRLADVPRRVFVLAFAPNGRLLAVGGEDDVRLLQLPSGRVVGRVDGCRNVVDSLAFSPDGKLLAVGGWDDAALICDVDALVNGKLLRPAAPPTAQDLDGLWRDLARPDSEEAYRAVGRLAQAPELSVPFLKDHLKPATGPDERRVARMIADLDNDDFEVREKASAALERMGPVVVPALQRALSARAPAEVRMRVQRLLQTLTDPHAPSLEVIHARVLEALENCGSAEARELLKDLSNGPPDDALTQEAKAALDRMEKRPLTPP